jgi:predicted DNA-binding protein
MRVMQTLPLSMPPEMLRRLDELARRSRRSRSALVREVLDVGLPVYERSLAAAAAITRETTRT